MEIARITVDRNTLQIKQYAKVTRGLVGAEIVFESFGPEWAGLSKTAVFRTYASERDSVNVQEGEPVLIPWEVLETSGADLLVGIYGTNTAGSVAIASTWAQLGKIAPGANPTGRPTEPPTPDWTEQIEGQVNAAMEAAQAVRPLTDQAAASAETAAEKARAASESERSTGNYMDAAREHAYAAAMDAKDARKMASEANKMAENAGSYAQIALNHAQSAGAAQTAAAESAQRSSASAEAAADKAREAAAQAENAKTQAIRAGEEADRAAGLIDDTAISLNKTCSSQKIRDDFMDQREQILRRVCPAMNQSGEVVTCIPLADRPIQVNARIYAAQEGEGEAGMGNGRKLKPVKEVTVFRSGINFLDLNGEKAGGEEYDYSFMPETGRVFRAVCPPEQYRRIVIHVPRNTDLYLTADKMNYRSVVQISNMGMGGDTIDASIRNGTVLSVKFNSGNHNRLVVSFYTAGEQIEYNAEGVRVTAAGDGRTDFKPYIGDVYYVKLPQPIWGGRADLTDGKLENFGEVLDLVNWPHAIRVEAHNSVTITGAYERYTSVLGFSHGLAQKEHPGKSSAGLFYGQIYIHTDPVSIDTIEDWNRFVAEQKAAGTPVQILCEKKTPELLSMNPIIMNGIKGANKIYTPQGRITVSGLLDPGEMINELTRRLTDMENQSEPLNGGI